MLKKLLFNMYDLNEILLYSFNVTEIYNRVTGIEKNNLSSLSLPTLKLLQEALEEILIKTDNFYKREFEVAIENEDEALIFKRMYNQVNKYINNYIKNDDGTQPIFVYLYKYENNHASYLDDLGGSIKLLEESMINDIDIKFLFLLLSNPSIRSEVKRNILLNCLFVNPNLDERLADHKKNIVEHLRYEDNAYYELDDFMKDTYDYYLNEYCLNSLKDIFYNLLTNTKINEESLKIYGLYIRSIFSSLDEEVLEQLNYDFNDINVNIVNKNGEETIRRAFRNIDTDKALIRHIKNIR